MSTRRVVEVKNDPHVGHDRKFDKNKAMPSFFIGALIHRGLGPYHLLNTETFCSLGRFCKGWVQLQCWRRFY